MVYYGTDTETNRRCDCGRRPVRRVAFAWTNVGRKFLGCPGDRCGYTHWVDAMWSPVLRRALAKLWEHTRARIEEIENEKDDLEETIDDLNDELMEKQNSYTDAMDKMEKKCAKLNQGKYMMERKCADLTAELSRVRAKK